MTQGSRPSPLDSTISTFLGTGTIPHSHETVHHVLERIQNGTYRTPIEQLRAIDQTSKKAAYTLGKEQLVSFTPCCDLKTRAQKVSWPEKLLSCTGLVHYDFDDVPEPEMVK